MYGQVHSDCWRVTTNILRGQNFYDPGVVLQRANHRQSELSVGAFAVLQDLHNASGLAKYAK